MFWVTEGLKYQHPAAIIKLKCKQHTVQTGMQQNLKDHVHLYDCGISGGATIFQQVATVMALAVHTPPSTDCTIVFPMCDVFWMHRPRTVMSR